jgi:hypothetical protein
MKPSEIRNWLGAYFLFTTVVLGAYILIFGQTLLLPMSKRDCVDAFQIIIPVLVAQVTAVFTWFTRNAKKDDDAPTNIPSWMVKGPPVLVIGIIMLTISAMVVSERDNGGWVDASTFKAIVTFAVTILNATSVLIVVRFFGKRA